MEPPCVACSSFVLLGSPALHAESGFISRLLNHPVPGAWPWCRSGTAQAPAVRYQDKPVLVVQEEGRRWIAIVGIPLKSAPGAHQLTTSDGRTLSFTVGAKHYREQHIKLKKYAPGQSAGGRHGAHQPRAGRTDQGLPDLQPCPAQQPDVRQAGQRPLSSPFGLRRFFNGEERNPHSGLDFAVGAGTPSKAPAAGKVILIGNYFFNGNTVFVDHGQGLISMFCHMSKIDVQLGQSLPRGGIVGRVGATGRATGPTCTGTSALNDARVDPAIFIGAFKP